MVSQATQTFVLEVLDYQIDFYVKLIIFGSIIFYAFLLNHLRKKTETTTFSHAMFVLFSSIYVYTTAFFLPLFAIMMFRDYAAISLWTLILQAYGIVFTVAALSLMIFGWQKALSFVGIDVNFEMMKRERKRKGEE